MSDNEATEFDNLRSRIYETLRDENCPAENAERLCGCVATDLRNYLDRVVVLEIENARLRTLAAEALEAHASLSESAVRGDAPNQIKIPMLPFRFALKDRLTRMVYGEGDDA